MSKQIIWLDWLSSEDEAKERKKTDCLFAGLSCEIPEAYRKAYKLTDEAEYCIFNDI